MGSTSELPRFAAGQGSSCLGVGADGDIDRQLLAIPHSRSLTDGNKHPEPGSKFN
jgi:hypothetical protein